MDADCGCRSIHEWYLKYEHKKVTDTGSRTWGWLYVLISLRNILYHLVMSHRWQYPNIPDNLKVWLWSSYKRLYSNHSFTFRDENVIDLNTRNKSFGFLFLVLRCIVHSINKTNHNIILMKCLLQTVNILLFSNLSAWLHIIHSCFILLAIFYHIVK